MPVRKPKKPINGPVEGGKQSVKVKYQNRFPDVQISQFGIYAYIDVETEEVVYVGKDSKINNYSRKWMHENKQLQFVDEEIQKNPERYRFEVVAIVKDETWMEDIETSLIAIFKANGQCKFNIEDTQKAEVLKGEK